MPLSHARFMVKLGLAMILLAAVVVANRVLGGMIITDAPAPPAPPTTADVIEVFLTFIIAGSGLLVAWIGWRTLRMASRSNTIAK